ncbi:MAG: M48 family metalloprotease, partial [Nocardioides sp.]
MSQDHRRTSVVVLAVGLVAFATLAALLVPWDPVPGELDPPSAEAVFSVEQIARAEAFSRLARVWSWSSLAMSLVATCWLGFSALGPRLVRRLPGPWWLQVVLAVAAVGVGVRLLTLPLGLLAHRHVVDYGLSTQSSAAYLVDVVKGEAIGTGTTALAVLLVVACARRWRRAWPAVAGGALGVLVLAGSWVYPIAIEPVFNDFEPLPAGSLRTAILDLADRQGVEVDGVLVADASRRTTTLNAYVSGLGSTRRVVVYDNLVEDLPQDQALSVVAHEFAHAKHRDVLVGSTLGVAGVVFGVGLLGVVVSGVGRRRGVALGEPAAVPLVLALVAVGSFLASPVQSTISRQVEARADVSSLRATGDEGSFVTMQTQLAT